MSNLLKEEFYETISKFKNNKANIINLKICAHPEINKWIEEGLLKERVVYQRNLLEYDLIKFIYYQDEEFCLLSWKEGFPKNINYKIGLYKREKVIAKNRSTRLALIRSVFSPRNPVNKIIIKGHHVQILKKLSGIEELFYSKKSQKLKRFVLWNLDLLKDK